MEVGTNRFPEKLNPFRGMSQGEVSRWLFNVNLLLYPSYFTLYSYTYCYMLCMKFILSIALNTLAADLSLNVSRVLAETPFLSARGATHIDENPCGGLYGRPSKKGPTRIRRPSVRPSTCSIFGNTLVRRRTDAERTKRRPTTTTKNGIDAAAAAPFDRFGHRRITCSPARSRSLL